MYDDDTWCDDDDGAIADASLVGGAESAAYARLSLWFNHTARNQ